MSRKSLLPVIIAIIIIVLEGLPQAPVAATPSFDLHAYPIIPLVRGAVYSHVRYVARKGIRRGNRTHVFSKIGDSITAFNYFLTPIGSGAAQLGSYGDLQKVIVTFSQDPVRTGNSFVNQSLAAHGAWTSGDLLDPNHADHATCAAGETPLNCELRIAKPGVALIMIGTNDLVFGDVAAFKNNLNQIVTVVELNSVVPVVSTIPYRRDNPALQDRVAAYNEAIVQVALAHNIPLWNYWLACEGLPSNGVSNDGIHPSLPPDSNTAIFDDVHLRFGFTIRNLTALQVLQRLMPALQ
ncbi:MAG: SGNH/GDSL hydrolase family protein [Chloroflexota bacterium]